MAAERWFEVKGLLARVAESFPLERAAKHWYEVEEAWERVDKIIGDPKITLERANAEGLAARYLLAGAQQAKQALLIGLMGPSPHRVLETLSRDARDLLRQMNDDEKGGPLGFGALPAGSYEPVTAAGAVIRDALLREYAEKAEVYMARLNDRLAQAVELLDRTYTDTWPADLPQADPEGPPPTG